MQGKVHHFGASGLMEGLAVLADRETRSHWDHITGEALSGPLAGYRLEVWPTHMTTVAAARAQQPELTIYPSTHRSIQMSLAQRLYPRFLHGKLWMPSLLRASMSRPVDPRLDKQTQGLGVITGKEAKFYPWSRIPSAGIRDRWLGRVLLVEREPVSGAPRARWEEDGQEPMQLLSRWYGFSSTYPGCEILE